MFIDIRIQSEAIENIKIETPESCGAEILFKGIVRNINHGKKVTGVSYDCEPILAKRALEEIAAEAIEQFHGIEKIFVVHRTGRLDVGEASVVIQVSSRHRHESYEGSRYVIEELKKRVPIWKQEHYVDGDSEWLKGHALCDHAH